MENKFAEGQLTKRRKAVSITNDTYIPAIQMQAIGSETYIKAVVSGTTLTIYADDTDGATTAVLTADMSAAGYDTWAELLAAINATGKVRAFLIGAMPSETTDLVAVASQSLKTENGVTFYYDPDHEMEPGFCITNNKFIGRPTGGLSDMRVGWTKDKGGSYNTVCRNVLDFLHFNVTSVGDGTIKIYSVDDENAVETLLWSNAYTSATAEEHGATDPVDPFLEAIEGQRLVVKISRTTVANDITAIDIQALGSTLDVCGGDVPGANYTGCV